MQKHLILAVIGIVSTYALAASAVVPEYIPVGGMLTDLSGTPRNGSFDIRFAIYDSEFGGAMLWSEMRDGGNQVAVTNGMFSVYLGEVTPIDFLDLINTSELWLGVKVGTDSEMNRIRMASVPFAQEAKYCKQVETLCGTGQILRGWDQDAGTPVCESDVNIDGMLHEGTARTETYTGAAAYGAPMNSWDFNNNRTNIFSGSGESYIPFHLKQGEVLVSVSIKTTAGVSLSGSMAIYKASHNSWIPTLLDSVALVVNGPRQTIALDYTVETNYVVWAVVNITEATQGYIYPITIVVKR